MVSILTTFVCLSAGLTQTASGAAQTGPPRISIVRDAGSFDGAGCSLQLRADIKKRNDHCVFVSDYEGNALMNIDGKDTKLTLLGRRESKGAPKKGDRSSWTYRAENIMVRVDCVVTGVCAPDDESCEVSHYAATITVTRRGGKRTIKATGICGS